LNAIDLISRENFEEIDKLHYSVENKLLALINVLQSKRNENTWVEEIHDPKSRYQNVQ